MVRPLAPEDLAAVVRLLEWMDAEAKRRVLAPEARSGPELAQELESPFVLADEDGVYGFVDVFPFWQGAAMLGPVAEVHPGPLLAAAEAKARELGAETLYAFPSEENEPLRTALEAAGFAPVHTTHFFLAPPAELGFSPPPGVEIRAPKEFDPEAYRRVYREADEGWSLRLSWSDEELAEHFSDPHNRVYFAYEGGEPVGMVELELLPPLAEVAYLGVVPSHRGRGIGQALLAHALMEAQKSGVEAVKVRAHDHEKEALGLYRKLGFRPLEAVVTYAKEL